MSEWKLENLVVVHKTADVPDANTGAAFDLEAWKLKWDDQDEEWKPHSLVYNRAFRDDPDIDERERGTTDLYEFDLSYADIDLAEYRYRLLMAMTTTSNAWLPESIYAIAQTDEQGWLVISAQPNWPSNKWFDREGTEASIGHDRRWISGVIGWGEPEP